MKTGRVINRITDFLRVKSAPPPQSVFQLKGPALFQHVFSARPNRGRIAIGGMSYDIAPGQLTREHLAATGIRGAAFIERAQITYFIDSQQLVARGIELGLTPPKTTSLQSLDFRAWAAEALNRAVESVPAPTQNQRYAKISEVRVGGGIVEADVYHINRTTYQQLGLRPEFIRGGSTTQVISRENHDRFSQALDIKPGDLLGTYAPDSGRANQGVLLNREERLAHRFCQVLVPEDCAAETLAHEMIHDYYFTMFKDDCRFLRNDFARQVFDSSVEALASPGNQAQAAFLKGVAARTGAGEFDFDRWIHDKAYHQDPHLKLLGMLFVAEVFAYAGTTAIGYPQEGEGKAPERIIEWLQHWLVNPKFLPRR